MGLARQNKQKEQGTASLNKLLMVLNMPLCRTDAFSKSVFLNASILEIWGWKNRGEN